MSILFITSRWPVPLSAFRSGTAIRMRMMLQGIQATGYPLDMLICPPDVHPWDASIEDRLRKDLLDLWGVQVRQIRVVEHDGMPAPPTDPGVWRSYVRPALSIFWQSAFERATGPRQIAGLQKALRELKPEFVFGHRLQSMCLLRRAGVKPPKALFDLDDIEHKRFARAVMQPPVWRTKRLLYLQVPALRKMERWALEHARCTFVCSDLDVAELTSAHPGCRVRAIPNTVPQPEISVLPSAKVVLFLGLLSYDPNRIGAEFLVHEVWPGIRERHPDAQLWIGGKDAEAVRGYDDPPAGVRFLGFVDDLDALYAATKIVASPIFSGGGTRIKIVEGALRARPIISTTLGAEGLDFSADREEIVLADTAAAFTDELGNLLDDHPRCERLAQRARARALSLYDESTVIEMIAGEIRGC